MCSVKHVMGNSQADVMDVWYEWHKPEERLSDEEAWALEDKLTTAAGVEFGEAV